MQVTCMVVTKIFWVGNKLGLGGIEILVARKWTDKIFDVKRVNDRLIMIKLLSDNCYKQIVAIASTFIPQKGLGESVKDKFYEDLISLVSKASKNELVMIGSDLNQHVGEDASGYDGTPFFGKAGKQRSLKEL